MITVIKMLCHNLTPILLKTERKQSETVKKLNKTITNKHTAREVAKMKMEKTLPSQFCSPGGKCEIPTLSQHETVRSI